MLTPPTHLTHFELANSATIGNWPMLVNSFHQQFVWNTKCNEQTSIHQLVCRHFFFNHPILETVPNWCFRTAKIKLLYSFNDKISFANAVAWIHSVSALEQIWGENINNQRKISKFLIIIQCTGASG